MDPADLVKSLCINCMFNEAKNIFTAEVFNKTNEKIYSFMNETSSLEIASSTLNSLNESSFLEFPEFRIDLDDENRSKIMFLLSEILLTGVRKYWVKYDSDKLLNVRSLILQTLEAYQHKDPTYYKLINVISEIALKDVPETWNDCFDKFISMAEDENKRDLAILVLSDIIKTIFKSSYLVAFRREILINFVKDHTKKLIELIKNVETENFNNLKLISDGTVNEDSVYVCYTVIHLLNQLCLFAPLEILNDDNFLQRIFDFYFRNEKTHDQSIEALRNLTIKRHDSLDTFDSTREIILSIISLALKVNMEGDDQPIVLTENLYKFILEYIDMYSINIEAYCVDDFNNKTEFCNYYYNILVAIFENAKEDKFRKKFWKLWSGILKRVVESKRGQFGHNVVYDALREKIVESLYVITRSGLNGCKVYSIDIQACWIFLYKLYKNTIPFLIDKVKTCFNDNESIQSNKHVLIILGLIECALTNKEEMGLTELLIPLLELNQKLKDFQYSEYLLFYLSRVLCFDNNAKELGTVYISLFPMLFNEFLGKESEIPESVLSALNFSATHKPSLFTTNIDKTSELFSIINTEVFLLFPEQYQKKYLCSVAKIAHKCNDPEFKSNSIEYIKEMIVSLLNSSNENLILNGLYNIDCLGSLNIKFLSESMLEYYNFIITIIKEAAQNKNVFLFNMATDSIIGLLKSHQYMDIIAQISDISVLLLELGQSGGSIIFDSSLKTLCKIRSTFHETQTLNIKINGQDIELCQCIINVFISPMINEYMERGFDSIDSSEKSALLLFYKTFDVSFNAKDLEFLINFSIKCLNEGSFELCSISCELLSVLFKEYELHNSSIHNFTNKICQGLFRLISDTFHYTIFDELIKTVHDFLIAIRKVNAFDSQGLVQIICQSITHSIKSVNENIRDFANNIVHNPEDFESFKSSVKDFLVTIRAASKSDKGLYSESSRSKGILDAVKSLMRDNKDDDSITFETVIKQIKNCNKQFRY